MRKNRRTIGQVANASVMVLLAILCVYPLWYTLIISFSDPVAVESGFVRWLPVGFSLGSYERIVADDKFIRAFGVSVLRVVMGGLINFVLTVTAAYPISKTKEEFKDKDAYVWFLILVLLFPPTIIPTFLTVKALGLMNTMWALVLPSAVPVFNVIVLANAFRGIPTELDEAAYMDGAGPWYLLLRVYVPLSTAAIATVTLFSIVYHWNDFFSGLIYMSNDRLYPLQTYIQQITLILDYKNLTQDQIRMLAKVSARTLNAAKVMVAMVPVIIAYPFLQRYFVKGITIGAVKE